VKLKSGLAEATNNTTRVSIVERFLLSEMKDHSDSLVLNAMQKIKSSGGNLRIKELLSSLPISVDPFEKRFRRLVGASPKQFSAIVRFRNLIMNHSPAESLTDTAHTAGYFDQAHFIKDFKSFTGQTPQDFFRSSSYW
jgi:methylphosphotriester-DNA--protein-cysteine methyltransferase